MVALEWGMRNRHRERFDLAPNAVACFLAVGLALLSPRPVTAQMTTGTYVGDGTVGRKITGLGFRPDVVIVKGNDSDGTFSPTSTILRSSTMVGDSSKPMVLDNPLVANEVQSLDADGFTVGSARRVNQGGITFYWAAFKVDADMSVGTYTGNGGAQSVAGLGFSPEYVIVMSSANRRAVQAASAAPVGRSFEFESNTWLPNQITSLDPTGFSVVHDGAAPYANASGVVYHYVAWNDAPLKTKVGSYPGNGADNRNITGVGFRPEYLIVKAIYDNNVAPLLTPPGHQRYAQMVGDATYNFAIGPAANHLQAFQVDGFQVGSALSVNRTFADCNLDGPGCTYFYVAFNAAVTLTLADHDAAQIGDQFAATTPVTTELFRFKLTRTGTVTVDNLRVIFTTTGGVADGDVASGELWRDDNNNGVIDGDTSIQLAVTPSGGFLAFNSLGEDPGVGGTNYIVRATVSNLVEGDTTTFSVGTADIDEVEGGVTESGAISNAVHTQDAAAGSSGDVYYSVGTDTTDLKTGTPTISISNGTATLSVSQTGNIGVGDEITYNGSTKVYIKSIITQSQFVVHAPAGGVPVDVDPAVTVNSIMRAFNDLATAELNSGTGSYLGNFDLTASTGINAKLTWVAYNDAPFVTASAEMLTIDDYTTDATHFITLTAAGASQVASGTSQRHNGTAGTGVVLDGEDTTKIGVRVQDPYTRVEWLELKRFRSANGFAAVEIRDSTTNVLVTHVLIHDFFSATVNGAGVATGATANDSFTLRNSIIYDGDIAAVRMTGPGDTATVENCTLYSSARGVYSDEGTATVTNTISLGNTTDFDASGTGGGMTGSHNMSTDGTAFSVFGSDPNAITGATSANEFVDDNFATADLHLAATAQAINAGTNLSGTFTNDIDDETRGVAWDMGADEAAVTVNYRSIGIAPAYTTGDVTANLGSTIVTGTGAWVTANRGRGDHIDINGNQYTILSVDSEMQLTLTSPAIATFTGPLYTISRQFTTLQAWETCISGGGGCVYFPVIGGDLVADHRSEVGIAYDDGASFAEILINASNTDADHDITLTVDPGNRHLGLAGTGVVLDNSACLQTAVRVEDEFVTVEWLEITNGPAVCAAEGMAVRNQALSHKITLRNNLIHSVDRGIITANNSDLMLDIYNNIIYGSDRGISITGGLNPGAVLRILNNTVYNNATVGITVPNGSVDILVQNNISHSNTTDFSVIDIDPASSNNLSSDITATAHSPAGGDVPSVLLANLNFVSTGVGTEDLHIQSGSAAEGQATNLSSIFTVDIDGGLRTIPWDIGADDISATGVNLTQIHYRWRNDDGGETVGGGSISETGSATSTGGSTPASITHGLTINANDVIVAMIHVNTNSTDISDNNGAFPFIEQVEEVNGGTSSRYAIYYRVAGASEPASYSFDLGGSWAWSMQIRVFSGVDTASVWDVAPSLSLPPITRDFDDTGTANPQKPALQNPPAIHSTLVVLGLGLCKSVCSPGWILLLSGTSHRPCLFRLLPEILMIQAPPTLQSPQP